MVQQSRRQRPVDVRGACVRDGVPKKRGESQENFSMHVGHAMGPAGRLHRPDAPAGGSFE